MACSFSSVITCINSALDDLNFTVAYLYSRFSIAIFKKQRYWLRNLKTFVLCARKLGDKNKDGSLGSLLIKIEYAANRKSQEISGLKDGDIYGRAKIVASNFQRDFQSLKEEIDEWYIAMLDDTQQSNSITVDEVGEITESIWDNLADFPSFREVFTEAMEVLREHMNILKNFGSFAASRGVDHGQMEDFLTLTVTVTLSASHLCFLCGDKLDDIFIEEHGFETDSEIDREGWQKGMLCKISLLVQKIKPIDPQVCEAYIQVISCSKLSTRLDAPTKDTDDDSTIVMKNFVDSLVYILWDMLRLDTCHVDCLKDNWQLLYEGLRSLRAILKKLPNSIDEETRDDIGVLVCDAGALVCSFYQKNEEIYRGLLDLLERLKAFVAGVEEEVPQTSTFNLSSINVLGFVDFLLENLMELTNGKVERIVQSRVQSIQEGLLYLRTFLGEIVELRHEQEELQALWDRVLDVTYRVEFLIDHLIVGDISDSFSKQFDSIIEDIQNIKTHTWKSSFAKRQDIKVKEVSSTSSHVLPSLKTDIVALQDEAMSIMNRLQRGSKELRVIAVVGMGGLGKTTLAAKVYKDPAIMRCFHVRAWCPVSQTFDKRSLLLELLNQIHPEKYSEMSEDDLAEKLRKHLKGKRYLIFLDDVWTIEAWNNLRASFPDDSTGSRIILTCRNHDVAMLDQEPLFLRELNKEESLELFRRKVFPGEDWPLELDNLGMQIAEKCKGLPLTIVIVAGLLRTTEQEGWKNVVDGLSSGLVSSIEQCMNSMELSYQHLPDYLKPCFLYFGAFPEDQEISVRRLIRLWIAEGFIRKSELKSLEDTAEDYMKDLIGRSLIMVAKERSIGGVNTCRIHDLLHDFCLGKAKGEHFIHLVKGYDELIAFNEPCNLRRLCIHSEPKHLKESKVFCPRARSLRFFPTVKTYSLRKEVSMNVFLVKIFKFVSVLDLGRINLGVGFPSEIELLVQLRYLAVRGMIRAIPSWVGNLSMLETFIVHPFNFGKVSLPDTIWNLQKLKYLYISSLYLDGGGILPSGNPYNSSVLYELDTFCGAIFICRGSMEEQMRKFPNIRTLKCGLFWRWDDTKEPHNVGVPDFLSRLESLTMIQSREPTKNIQYELSFPANLRKLTLREFKLPWSKISTIGKLPNLEVLKLLPDSFRGETWEMEEGEFPKLKYLKLSGCNLVRWTDSDSDDQFPCIQKLVLERCWYLKEMPTCLESIPTLKMIEVRNGSEATTTFVKHIQEEQVSMGNSAFNIFLIESSDDDDFDG